MDVDQLRYFRAVAELGTFTRAAQQLHISQPALSRAIQRLEDELGQPLFERTPRAVSLTEAGELFQLRAEQILTILEDTKSELCDDGQSGRLRVGAIPTIAPYFLPNLLRKFSDEYPRASLLVQEATTDELIRRCKQGELDIGILALPIPAKYVDIEPLFDEELLLVVPAEHSLATKSHIAIADLEPYPFVLLDEAHCLSDNITSFCRQRSIHPVAVEKTNQLIMVQELVSLSHGISMVPDMARQLDHDHSRVYRSFSGVKPTRTVAAISNPYRFQSKLLKHFRSALIDYAESSTKGLKGRNVIHPPAGKGR